MFISTLFRASTKNEKLTIFHCFPIGLKIVFTRSELYSTLHFAQPFLSFSIQIQAIQWLRKDNRVMMITCQWSTSMITWMPVLILSDSKQKSLITKIWKSRQINTRVLSLKFLNNCFSVPIKFIFNITGIVEMWWKQNWFTNVKCTKIST